jgi:hypothetical protein
LVLIADIQKIAFAEVMVASSWNVIISEIAMMLCQNKWFSAISHFRNIQII